jgi:membrane protease YdiL (CAAX protease family)
MIAGDRSLRVAVLPTGIVVAVYAILPILAAASAICIAAAVAIASGGKEFYFSATFVKYSSNLEVFAGELALLAISGIVAAIVWTRRGSDLRIFEKSSGWVDALLGVGAAVIFHFVVRGFLLPWLYLAMPVGAKWISREYQPILGYASAGVTQVAGSFFLNALYKPVVETILFVGFLYRGLRSLWGVTASLLFASVIFAALHKNGPLFLDFFLLGLVNFALFEFRKSLAAPLIQHVSYNILVFGSQVLLLGKTAP